MSTPWAGGGRAADGVHGTAGGQGGGNGHSRRGVVRSHTVIPPATDGWGYDEYADEESPEPETVRIDIATLLSVPPGPSAGRPAPGAAAGLGVQARRVLAMCAPGVVSVAEVAAYLEMPGGVVRALVADLVVRGHLLAADPFVPLAQPHEKEFLERILDGLQKL